MNIGLTSFETSFDFDFSMADRAKQKKKYGSQLFQGKYGSYRNTFHEVMPFKAQLKPAETGWEWDHNTAKTNLGAVHSKLKLQLPSENC